MIWGNHYFRKHPGRLKQPKKIQQIPADPFGFPSAYPTHIVLPFYDGEDIAVQNGMPRKIPGDQISSMMFLK